jgi:hypothetical protein
MVAYIPPPAGDEAGSAAVDNEPSRRPMTALVHSIAGEMDRKARPGSLVGSIFSIVLVRGMAGFVVLCSGEKGRQIDG